MKCEKMLEDTQSREDTPQSWSGEDTSILCQGGQLTRLNPISGEDSRHTSILCQERTVNTPQSWSREDTPQSWSREDNYISGEGTPQSCVDMGEEHLNPYLIMVHRTSKTEGEGKRWRWPWRKFCGKQRDVNKLKGASVVLVSVSQVCQQRIFLCPGVHMKQDQTVLRDILCWTVHTVQLL